MSESVTLKSYFYEVLIPSSQKNTSSPIEDILHHVSISFMKKLALYKCFNPRTHTGCDTTIRRPPRWSVGFNPRTHTGCDAAQTKKSSADMFQSTHPHGVRLHNPKLSLSIVRFQSTHPHGVRLLSASLILINTEFQSTHPHGVRRHLSISCCISEEFQSTHPHGVRLGSMLIFPKCGNVSIHAPTRGATIVSSKKVFDGYVSIHAPTRGATVRALS